VLSSGGRVQPTNVRQEVKILPSYPALVLLVSVDSTAPSAYLMNQKLWQLAQAVSDASATLARRYETPANFSANCCACGSSANFWANHSGCGPISPERLRKSGSDSGGTRQKPVRADIINFNLVLLTLNNVYKPRLSQQSIALVLICILRLP
jgi:hypothetical protein